MFILHENNIIIQNHVLLSVITIHVHMHMALNNPGEGGVVRTCKYYHTILTSQLVTMVEPLDTSYHWETKL